MAEVRRLEGVKLAQMVALVRAKEGELRALCEDTHVEPPPQLAGCMEALDSAADSPGSAANLLAALISMLAEVEVRVGVGLEVVEVGWWRWFWGGGGQRGG
jgi:hypothetical protein